MVVALPRTDTALAECRAHLAAASAGSPDLDVAAVGSYLASHVALLLCAEVEATMTDYFDELIDSSTSDESVKRLARSRAGAPPSANYSDLAETVARLGRSARDTFRREAVAAVGEVGIAELGNIVLIRDSTNYSTSPRITFSEVESATQVAKGILQAARIALRLP